ncbi:nucleotide pyrophosphatase/phosphodiesterase family protein [Engelhardtia mirabilis]|uniref:Type I phosphodiesterase / nucleotide pyrophosphatase n=1 Tax=Engelhardtia mirabilis TaxID=2528011 RepID=A0A518BR74_9BACT|nr:Type I phosphodiesterase / nucleotide pyrophosphatase [Planctomycetes bacterium Pla133]QDV03800.1 Type I phosphodiesterase / nucleotide pyrophosphatase [Planctomycetes bacterium Pla86]
MIDVVGLSERLIDESTPNLQRLRARGAGAPMDTVLPAVTLSAQATMLTGLLPRDHGVVGNGWYWRDLGEVLLWRQPNHLVGGEKLYDRARRRDPGFTCAKLFWWWNMGAAVEWSLTPRPFYPADGRKIPATYGWPRDFKTELEGELGAFPFFDFWGPKSGLPSSRWLTDAAIHTLRTRRPSLTMVYLPHLDYSHQRLGPDAPESRRAVVEVDALIGELVAAADAVGAETVVVSEYALEAVNRPVHVNRALRDAGLLEVRETPAGEVLDVFGSRAFAVADHQMAHVYCADERAQVAAREVLEALPGVARVLGDDKREFALDHERSGELVALAEPDAWFTYYYWNDDSAAPDFARTVDIHRKPGYDPVELFVDPALKVPALRVARRLAQKVLGFRYLMDVIPLDASLVKGSHGLLPSEPSRGPVFLCSRGFDECGGDPSDGTVAMTSVSDRVLALLER